MASCETHTAGMTVTKRVYRSRKEALRVRDFIKGRNGLKLNVYHCVLGCHGWHLGHEPGTKLPT